MGSQRLSAPTASRSSSFASWVCLKASSGSSCFKCSATSINVSWSAVLMCHAASPVPSSLASRTRARSPRACFMAEAKKNRRAPVRQVPGPYRPTNEVAGACHRYHWRALRRRCSPGCRFTPGWLGPDPRSRPTSVKSWPARWRTHSDSMLLAGVDVAGWQLPLELLGLEGVQVLGP